jgi:predicted restriction endonuclease
VTNNTTKSYHLSRLKRRNKASAIYKELALRYEYKCAVCRWSIPFQTPNKQEQLQGGCDMHHIIAVKDGGLDVEYNLILLCPNHHKLADTGIITVDEQRSYLKLRTNIIGWIKSNYNVGKVVND